MNQWGLIFGKMLMLMGVLIFVIGLLFSFMGQLPQISWLGRLPGDIHIRKENFSFYFPLTTCLLISAILTLLFWFFSPKK